MKRCARDGIVCRVTAADLEIENGALRQQLVERDAAIADRDNTIAKLAKDIATLQDTVKKLLAQRGAGGHRVPEGQGLLFADAIAPVEPTPASTVDAEPDDGSGDDADQSKQPTAKKKGTPRKPGKIDTTGLPRKDRLHDVPEAQRIDPVTGKPLV